MGAHLTKPGWSKPHTHSNPTNLALFRHKITLYRFNQGGSYYCKGLKWEQGAEPPEPPRSLQPLRTARRQQVYEMFTRADHKVVLDVLNDVDRMSVCSLYCPHHGAVLVFHLYSVCSASLSTCFPPCIITSLNGVSTERSRLEQVIPTLRELG